MAKWEARLRCTVYKNVTLDGCTLEQAFDDPWEYAVDEIETDQVDWEIEKIEAAE